MRRLAALFLVVIAVMTSQARADDPVSIELVNGGYSGEGDKAVLGFKVKLDRGWHTYWKTAGEGGFAPEIDTDSSENLSSFDIRWPAPERIETLSTGALPFQTNGYTNEVVLPVVAQISDPSKTAKVSVALRLFACRDICSAFERKFETELVPGFVSRAVQKEVAEWLRRVPRSSGAGLSLSEPVPSADGGFEVDLKADFEMKAPWLHVANKGNAPYTVKSLAVDPSHTRFKVVAAGNGFEKADGIELVAVSDGHALAARFSTPAVTPVLGLGMLFTALLGGLVLNLMPCVFPVLSLKLMSITKGDAGSARAGFAGSSLGIVASFLFLGGVLSAMKAAGTEIGWGIQFQNVGFLSLMTVVVLAFAAGTAGLFELTLPGRAATALTRITSGSGFGASAGQGFVATLLATPCSAPFVGTAVGFALAGSATDILAVFAAMGAGMALPYLAVAALPGLARLMPKPGVWMHRVRLVLSIALFATAGWLVSTIAAVSTDAVYMVAAVVALSALVASLLNLRGVRLAFAVVALAAFSLPGVVERLPSSDRDGIPWKEFAPGAIPALVSDGKTVLVYMTAKWCLTCKVNDRTTWSSSTVIDNVNKGAVAMKGDWTRPDPRISAFLKANGRFGIPFTVVYSPSNPDGEILPEILSPAVVVETINRHRDAIRGL